MAERQPSVREIRVVLQELEDADPPVDENNMERARDKLLQELDRRFPKLTTAVLSQALEVHGKAAERCAGRLNLDGQRAQAVSNFLGNNMYANIEEAADNLGLLSLQEVWDLIMEQAGLPPNQAPETLEVWSDD